MYLQIARSREREDPKALCWVLPFEADGFSDITQGIPTVRVIPFDLSHGMQLSSSSSANSTTDIDGIRDGGSKADAGWYLSLRLGVRKSDPKFVSFGGSL